MLAELELEQLLLVLMKSLISGFGQIIGQVQVMIKLFNLAFYQLLNVFRESFESSHLRRLYL